MFKVNNKNTRRTSMTYEHISHLNSSVSVADIEQVNVKALEFFLLMTYQSNQIRENKL